MASIDIQGMCHVGIRVHDLERSLAFYELLGFRKVVGPVGPEPVAILTHPSGVEINLVLNAPDADAPNPLMDVPEKLPGYTHMALLCTDVEAAEEVLAAAGHPLSSTMNSPKQIATFENRLEAAIWGPEKPVTVRQIVISPTRVWARPWRTS